MDFTFVFRPGVRNVSLSVFVLAEPRIMTGSAMPPFGPLSS